MQLMNETNKFVHDECLSQGKTFLRMHFDAIGRNEETNLSLHLWCSLKLWPITITLLLDWTEIRWTASKCLFKKQK